MALQQYFPYFYGTKHGYVRNLDLKIFENSLKRLDWMEKYFDVSMEGLENIPANGGALLVGNHGPMGMDAPFVIKRVYEERGRVVRGLADRAIFKMPLFRVNATQMGILEGDRVQATEMLEDGNLLSVYPGGLRETVKKPDEKYQLRQFWKKSDGFVKVCLASGAPIIPVACVGIDDIFTQFRTGEEMKDTFGMKIWQRMMKSDKYTTPMYMGIGPFPFREKLDYFIGEPIPMNYGPEAVNDPEVVAELKEKTIVAIEDLLDKGLKARHLPDRSPRYQTGAIEKAKTKTAKKAAKPKSKSKKVAPKSETNKPKAKTTTKKTKMAKKANIKK